MDLMKKLRDVPSPGAEAYDQARADLLTAMTEPAAAVVRPQRWFSWPRAGAAVLAAAAVVAAVVVIGPPGGDVPAGTAPSEAAPRVVESPLVKLASDVRAAAALPGDSSLVIGTKPAPDSSPYVFYTVYTDRGQIFKGDSAQNLAASAGKNDDQAQPYDAKVMAAARQAASGDVEKARIAMITVSGNAFGVGLSPAEADRAWAAAEEKKAEVFRRLGKEVPAPRPRPTGEELENLIGNHLWSNTTYALFVGAANAEVRAGVLKLLATMPDVTIGEADLEGRPVLTLTAAAAILGGGGSQVLTIDAGNGLPIRSEVVPAAGSPDPSTPSVVQYRSSRVHLADVVAGKI
ncbi:hypothetical protein ADL03_41310 [Nocardia sp. NRRL S-836]|nr:hypothetical protein ADL03_41310 [Nocardia sp. NRRL S-836]